MYYLDKLMYYPTNKRVSVEGSKDIKEIVCVYALVVDQ